MDRLLNYLQTLATLVVLFLFSTGRGAHGVFIAIFLAIPVLRLIFSRNFRRKIFERAGVLWEELKGPLERISWSALFWWIAFPALCIFLVNGVGISSNDNYPTVMSAASLYQDRNLELSEYFPRPKKEDHICKEGFQNPYYVWCTPHGLRSAYPLGMLLPLLPPMGLAKVLGRDLADADLQWRLSKWTSSLMAAFCLCLFFYVARSWVSFEPSIFVTYFLLLGSTFTSIVSQGIWSHNGVVLTSLLVLFFEVSPIRLSETRRLFIYGCLLAWMFSCRLNSVSVLVPLTFYLMTRRGFRFCFILGVVSLLLYAPLGYYYQVVYGTFLGPQYVMHSMPTPQVNPLEGLKGILFSPAHGLLPYQPWLLLLVLYVLAPIRKRLVSQTGRVFWIFVSVASVVHIGIASQWWCWWGGTWGSRLQTEIVPLLAFLVLFPVEKVLSYGKPGKRFLLVLLIVSFYLHAAFLFLAAGFWKGNLMDWSSPPFLFPFLKS